MSLLSMSICIFLIFISSLYYLKVYFVCGKGGKGRGINYFTFFSAWKSKAEVFEIYTVWTIYFFFTNSYPVFGGVARQHVEIKNGILVRLKSKKVAGVIFHQMLMKDVITYVNLCRSTFDILIILVFVDFNFLVYPIPIYSI